MKRLLLLLLLSNILSPLQGLSQGDLNCDGRPDLTDAVYLLMHLFQGGERPVVCSRDDDRDFGERVAGTYLYTCVESEGLPLFVGLMTLTSCGSFVVSQTRQFGYGDLAGNGFLSLEQAAWRQIGPNQIATSSLTFAYDANGELSRMFRVRADLSFERDFIEFGGLFNVDIFTTDQNPLDDPPAQENILVGTVHANRLRPTAGDVNCDGSVNLTDAVYLLGHLFQGGPAPLDCAKDKGDLARRVTGVHLYQATPEDREPWWGLLTVTRDGTTFASETRQFGAGDLAANGFLSLEHGVWRQSGPGDLSTFGLTFGYDANGKLLRLTRTFADFQAEPLSGAFRGDAYLGDPIADLCGGVVQPLRYAPEPPNRFVGALDAGCRLVGEADEDFGRQVAGAYFYWGEVPEFPPFFGFNVLMADGTYIVSHTRQYGMGDPAGNGYMSTEHGVWRRTGPREIETESLNFQFGENGQLFSVFTVRGVMTFDEGLTEFRGPFTVDAWTQIEAGQDPCTDEPDVRDMIVGQVHERRITVE